MELHKAKVEVDCESICDESEHETKKGAWRYMCRFHLFHFFLPSAKDGAKDEQGSQERLSLNVDIRNK